jgi:RNA polymerase sigma-70 factor, ECF subfamily
MNMPERKSESGDDAATDAFVVLLMEHRHRLYAFIAKQLVNPADVEDVFQKTSVVLWKKMDQFERDGSFFHWACGIAFHEVLNFLKGQRRSKLHFDSELVHLLAAEAAEEAALTNSRLAALRHCMKTLSERQQQILRSCYMGTDSITEVADQLGRQRTALYKQLARLKEKLLGCIQKQVSVVGGES